MKRRLPKPADLAPLIRFKKPVLNPVQRRLANAHTIEDLRRVAKRTTPRAAFDYTDGAAEHELSLSRARQAFRDVELHPAILRDVSKVDLGRDVLGRRSELPFGIAPTGFTRLMHTEGEIAGATAAGDAGIPYTLSTMGTTSIEDVAAANPDGRNWFQLYMWKDRDRSMGTGRTGCRGRLRDPRRHRRRAGRRRSDARRPQRYDDPADSHPPDRGQRASRDPSGGTTCSPLSR